MTMVDVGAFIEQALAEGRANGLAMLSKSSALVFVISEAEVCCDMDGIDTFIDSYGTPGLVRLASAYGAVGAGALASACRAVADAMPNPDEALLERLNSLVQERAGYDYESLCAALAKELTD